MSDVSFSAFADLGLETALLKVLQELGYESPSPIQAATIPILLSNRDVLGQAQTGTGKTAAFALPILARIDTTQKAPQALVLAPTRELAIQVAEAFQRYATYISDFHVLPIYGGQSYGPQLNALRRGVHVIVGTPGRIIDHLEKGSLDISNIRTLVLDEADEMLRMGFIDDVENILKRTPASRQTALFSATMPAVIKRMAQTYLRDPAQITIAAKTGTADNIRQRYWLVSGMHKLDALTRILEAEPFDGMIIFARTKLGTEELAVKLQARGFAAAAINGDLAQQQRERTIQQLKDGKIDILVATDVAARGLDVERISHVINYDVPPDPESYTHRIGRTGRAGRSGEAILFVSPRERSLLKAIERSTRQPIARFELPSIQMVNDVRIARFKEQITDALDGGGLEIFRSLIEDLERERGVPTIEIAAALAKIARGDMPFLLAQDRADTAGERSPANEARDSAIRQGTPRAPQPQHREVNERPVPACVERSERLERSERPERPERPDRSARKPEAGMQSFRIEVGHRHGVKPGNIVGAIANETGLESRYIGRIEIHDDHSTLDLPSDLPDEMLGHLKKVWVAGQQLRISRSDAAAVPAAPDAATHLIGTTGRAGRRPDIDHNPARRVEQEKPENPRDARPVAKSESRSRQADVVMETFRIEVGRAHGVKPASIATTIASEVGLDARHIGRIEMLDQYSVLELPAGMPKSLFKHLQTVSVAGHPLRIRHSVERLSFPGAAQSKAGTTPASQPAHDAARRSRGGPGSGTAHGVHRTDGPVVGAVKPGTVPRLKGKKRGPA